MEFHSHALYLVLVYPFLLAKYATALDTTILYLRTIKQTILITDSINTTWVLLDSTEPDNLYSS